MNAIQMVCPIWNIYKLESSHLFAYEHTMALCIYIYYHVLVVFEAKNK